MKKSTHTGTCQACGRAQALPAGVLAKHGYTVKWGFFSGTCAGSGQRPLEIDRHFCDEIIQQLGEQAAAADARAIEYENGSMVPFQARAGFDAKDRNGRWVEVMVPYADADEYHQKQAIDNAISTMRYNAKEMRAHAGHLCILAERIHGKQELQPRGPERTELSAGMTVRFWDQTFTVVEIKGMTAHGVGPFLNGKWMLHAILRRENGTTFARPVRLIRQSSIDRANLLLSGMHRAATEIVCGYCNGSGWEPLVRESSSGQQGERCPQCNGVGRRWV